MITSQKGIHVSKSEREDILNKLVPGDLEILNEYLATLEKRTESMVKIFSNVFFKFIAYVNKSNLMEINKDEALGYISLQKSNGFKKPTLLNNRRYLDNFFSFYEDKVKIFSKTYKNPIPSLKKCGLAGNKRRTPKPELNPEDERFLDNFLEEAGRRTNKGMATFKNVIYQFLNFTKKSNLKDIKVFEVKEWFKELEQRELKPSSKESYRSHLDSFFDSYQWEMQVDNEGYRNPVPPKKHCKFSPDPFTSIAEQERKERESRYTISQMKEILKSAYKYNEYLFLIFTLLVFCGMRISECVTIEIANINVEERYFVTGVVKDARKSNKSGKKPLYFCVPDYAALMLKQQITYVKRRYGENCRFLFAKNNRDYYKGTSIPSFVKKFNFDFEVKTHTFRKTLISFMMNPTNKVPLHIAELLTNHVVTSVTMRDYQKITIEERRKFYDESLPKEYKELLDYLKHP